MDDFLKDMLGTFISEAMDFLDDAEPKLILLSQNSKNSTETPETSDAINTVFRAFHTLKGNAQAFKLDSISRVAHHSENLLSAVRAGTLSLDQHRLELLFQAFDLLRRMLHIVEKSQAEGDFSNELDPLIAALDAANVISKSPLPLNPPPTSDDGIFWVTDDIPPPSATPSSSTLPPTIAIKEEAKVIISEEMKNLFIQEATELLEITEKALLEMHTDLDNPNFSPNLEKAFRAMHSLKGNCGFMGHLSFQEVCHLTETLLDSLKNKTKAQQNETLLGLIEVLDGMQNALKYLTLNQEPCYDGMLAILKKFHVNAATPIINANNPKNATPKTSPIPIDNNKTRQDVRVDLRKLDTLIDLIGELVIAETMVTGNPELKNNENEQLQKSIHQLQRLTSELQDVAMSVRMVPVSQVFQKMVRIVHDLSIKTKKKTKLELRGEDTEVDRTLVEKISDPLVHAVRNSIDHGLESPEIRIAAGKNETGTLIIEAQHQSGEVWISISDDGAGLNYEKIVEKALQRGLIKKENLQHMTTQQVNELVFEPGFSTAEALTELSGRGVGMDVVRRNIEALKGRVTLDTTPGQGTKVVFQIPLTLAVIDGMLVRVADSKYTIPMLAIQESLRMTPELRTVGPDGQEFVSVRNLLIPIIRMHDIYEKVASDKSVCDGICVIVKERNRTMALFADEILGQQQTVIKALPEQLVRAKSVAGCTILGTGEISLIVDVLGISNILKQRYDNFTGTSS